MRRVTCEPKGYRNSGSHLTRNPPVKGGWTVRPVRAAGSDHRYEGRRHTLYICEITRPKEGGWGAVWSAARGRALNVKVVQKSDGMETWAVWGAPLAIVEFCLERFVQRYYLSAGAHVPWCGAGAGGELTVGQKKTRSLDIASRPRKTNIAAPPARAERERD